MSIDLLVTSAIAWTGSHVERRDARRKRWASSEVERLITEAAREGIASRKAVRGGTLVRPDA
jgi:hypothetical protein